MSRTSTQKSPSACRHDIESIKVEIEQRFGGACPTFFLLARESPEAVEQLWRQTQFAYLDNPLPMIFKERLFAYLSRFCEVPYCVARHSAFLILQLPDSGPGGAFSADQVVDLLQRPVPSASELQSARQILANTIHPFEAWPPSNSTLEESIFTCAVSVFLRDADRDRCESALRSALGLLWYNRLLTFLSFVRSAHFWTETHCELELESDVLQLLQEHRQLAKWLATYQQDVKQELRERFETEQARLQRLCETLQQTHVQLQSVAISQANELAQAQADKRDAERELRIRDRAILATQNGVLITDNTLDDNPIIFVNPAVEVITGFRREEMIGRNCRFLQGTDRDQPGIVVLRNAIRQGTSCRVVVRNYRKDGSLFWNELTISPVIDNRGVATHFVGIQNDVTVRHQAASEQQRYNRILDSLSSGTSIDELLALVVRIAKEERPGMMGTIMLLDDARKSLHLEYADELPNKFARAIDGSLVEEGFCSCATAAHRGESVIVDDIAKSPLWASLHDVADAAEIRACWSEPIHTPGNGIVGTIAMYFREPTPASQSDKELLKHSAQLASIVIDRARKSDKLRKQEREFRMLADNVPEMFSYVDAEQRYRFVNRKYEEIHGKPRDQIVGRHVREIIGDAIYEASVRQNLERALAGERVTFENAFAVNGGPTRWMSTVLIPDVDENESVRGMFGLITDMTERRMLEKQVLDIAAEENRRIGNDLHDGVGQELTGLAMIADALAVSLMRKSLPEVEMARKMEAGIKHALKQVRMLSRGMNPVDIDGEGLMSSLSEMSHHLNTMYNVDCTFRCDEPVLLHDNQSATQLFRIAQEATTNAVKHGKAKHIVVSLGKEDGVAVLRVEDDGVGVGEITKRTIGTGMRTMGYRAGMIGAHLRIASLDSGGTEVSCSVRCDTAHDSK